jgi:hypothetical protein
MKKFSDGFVISKWRSAVKLANDCVNATDSGFPDRNTILNLATAILTTDLATGGAQSTNKHAGQDADQESMLAKAFEAGSAAQVRPSK